MANYRKTKVFLTGATGVMGGEGLRQLMQRTDRYDVTVLARDSNKNRLKLRPHIDNGLNVIWGDLLDKEKVSKGVTEADIVLHVGGMVSPAADWHPGQTIKTNVESTRIIIKAALKSNPEVKLVYVGSVSQYGDRRIPDQWGASGDALQPALYDAYAYSKIEAERILAESGLRRWVSLRQTGILHSGLLMKASDPIAFHVPLRGCIEWVTAEDSGRLLERVCRDDVPESFWGRFYNIGGGKAYRMTNYEFEKRLLHAMGCPKPEKVFDARWFATRNFHGMWYRDSDELEELLHFRSGKSPEAYFDEMKRALPWYFKLAPLAPGFAIKAYMKRVANTPVLGPMWWISQADTKRIDACWGSIEEWRSLPAWDCMDLDSPEKESPGDVHKPDCTLQTAEKIAAERGGSVSKSSETSPFSQDTELEMQCEAGHTFRLRARTLISGGHWCPKCMEERLGDIKETLK